MAVMNCERMVIRLARRVEDQAHSVTDEAQKLQSLDEACQDLKVRLVEQYQNDDLDFVDISSTSGVAITEDLTEFVLPEWCFKPRFLEDVTTPGSPLEIPNADLHNKEQYRSRYFPRVPACWLFSRGGNVFQRIAIRGSISGIKTFRVWYIRRLAPLHYGTAQANASTGKIALAVDGAATTKGRVLGRDLAYDGFAVEVTGGTPSALKDQLRMLSGHVGSTGLCDVHAPWSVAPSSSTTYALVTPIAQEHHELIVSMAAVKLLQDTGSASQIALVNQEVARQFAQFEASAAKRQAQTPKYIRFNSAAEGW